MFPLLSPFSAARADATAIRSSAVASGAKYWIAASITDCSSNIDRSACHSLPSVNWIECSASSYPMPMTSPRVLALFPARMNRVFGDAGWKNA